MGTLVTLGLVLLTIGAAFCAGFLLGRQTPPPAPAWGGRWPGACVLIIRCAHCGAENELRGPGE